MIRLAYLVLVMLLFACDSRKNSPAETTTRSTENVLTETQTNEGWVLLFNGENLDGWRTFKNRQADSWEVVDGLLHCKPFDSAEHRADLITLATYDNFELAFEWKISYQGNSGVMFHVSEEFDQPYFSGPEYQLIDDIGYPGVLAETQRTAANYDMHVPAEETKPNPAGQWNYSRLVVDGNKVVHWLNGEKVVDYELHSDDWLARKNGSKWKDVAGYGMSTSGHIALQDHGMEVWYRNVMIKPL